MIGYGMPYMNMSGNYMNELQNMRDRIDSQIQQVQQQQQSMPQLPIQQPTNLTQNFQLAPNSTSSNFRMVNSIDDVEKEIVVSDTYFMNKELSNLWIKNSKGDIRIFEVTEIIPKDEKDILIEKLQKQIEELKGVGINEQSSKPNDGQFYEQSDAGYAGSIGESIETSKPIDVPSISNSKTTKRKSQ